MDSSNALSCRERRLNNSSNVSETCGNVSETCPYLPRCIEVLFSRRRVYKQDYGKIQLGLYRREIQTKDLQWFLGVIP